MPTHRQCSRNHRKILVRRKVASPATYAYTFHFLRHTMKWNVFIGSNSYGSLQGNFKSGERVYYSSPFPPNPKHSLMIAVDSDLKPSQPPVNTKSWNYAHGCIIGLGHFSFGCVRRYILVFLAENARNQSSWEKAPNAWFYLYPWPPGKMLQSSKLME